MFRLLVLACTVSVALAQYQPQYQQARYQQAQYQQPQYQQQQQQPQYQQVQYQPAEPVPTAAQYPAGVDAQSCPNYPDCANPLLALQAVAKASDPRYQAEVSPRAPQALHQSQHEYSPEVQQKLDRGEYIGDGDYHGEGLDEALAPETAVRSGYAAQQQQSAGQYPAQQAASQYSAQPGAVQYPAQIAASQYAAQPQYPVASQYAARPGAVQYPAQVAASQYAAQPGAVQYPAQRAASQYAAQQSPRYITAPQARYYQPQARASLFTPQYQPAPVHEGSSYSSNALASASEPVASVQLPAGIDASSCPNYPFCQSS